MNQHGVIGGLKAFVASWRRRLEATGFEAGCPVLAVAVDRYVGEASDKDDEAAQQHLLGLADGVFVEWRQIMPRTEAYNILCGMNGKLEKVLVSSFKQVALTR